tara:strand:+ start:21442 stop:22875 length:1434 start_codon:yes stop_codon:yes gene_type:complete
LLNPLLNISYKDFEKELGDFLWDKVNAAKFPITKLRFRNNNLFKLIGINPSNINDEQIEEAFGKFLSREYFLALRYHGYQFGTYNPELGDGRGFLYGLITNNKNSIEELGTKGSGQTPWSRGGDGRLTLKGGVREIIASEALNKLGVTTSRTLSLIETGEELWRGDEESPTRSSVMMRVAKTHLRFGTCERLLYNKDIIGLKKVIIYVIKNYYKDIWEKYHYCKEINFEECLIEFYSCLTKRISKLAAEWMASGFTHGVLNTDNMSLAGESFDYGPYAFIKKWDPNFTAAYFDQTSLYSFGNQARICYSNLLLLQNPLSLLIKKEKLQDKLEAFDESFRNHFNKLINLKLGLKIHKEDSQLSISLVKLLSNWDIEYSLFFNTYLNNIKNFKLDKIVLSPNIFKNDPPKQEWNYFSNQFHKDLKIMNKNKDIDFNNIFECSNNYNIRNYPDRDLIERIWEPIEQEDNWESLYRWINEI